MVIFRRLLFFIVAIGFLLFTILFSLSYINPLFVEKTAREFIRIRITSATEEKIDSLSDHALLNKAQQILKKNDDEMARLKQQLTDDLPEKVASVMDSMLYLDDEQRKKYKESTEARIKNEKTWRLTDLSTMQEQLTSFMQGKYIETTQNLSREFRIFTGTNSVAFFILLVSILMQRVGIKRLFVPAYCLLLATIVVGYSYIFDQNWLNTILFSNYQGFGYVALITYTFLRIYFEVAREKVDLYEKK